jgi:hypothetical protein
MSCAFVPFGADIAPDTCSALLGHTVTVWVRFSAGCAASGIPSVMEGVILATTAALEEYDQTLYRG